MLFTAVFFGLLPLIELVSPINDINLTFSEIQDRQKHEQKPKPFKSLLILIVWIF